MSTKLKLLRKLEYYLNDAATKGIFISLIQLTKMCCCLTNLNFRKTQEEKLNMLERQAESTFCNNLNIIVDELIYEHAVKMVKKCIELNVC